MGMLGNQPAAGVGSISIANDSFNGTGSATSFTLSQTVSATTDIEVIVDNVQQSPYDGSYSVSGTTLTFSGAPSAGTNNIYVIYNHARTITTNQVIPDDGSVTHSKFHTTALNPITLDPSNNRVGVGTATPAYTLHSTTSSGSDYAGYFHNSAGSGNGTGLLVKGGANNSGAGTFIVQDYGGNEDFKVDGLGRVTYPNQPGFSVRQLAQSNIDCSSGGYVAFRHLHTTHFNTGNHFDSSTGRFTAPVAGNYIVGATIRYDGFGGSYFYASIYKNGNFYARDLKQQTGAYLHASVHTIVNMSANDNVYIEIANSGDNNISLDHDCNFYGFLLG